MHHGNKFLQINNKLNINNCFAPKTFWKVFHLAKDIKNLQVNDHLNIKHSFITFFFFFFSGNLCSVFNHIKGEHFFSFSS